MVKKKKEKLIQLSISMPETLLKQIDEMAVRDNRGRSNFICTVFLNLIKKRKESDGE